MMYLDVGTCASVYANVWTPTRVCVAPPTPMCVGVYLPKGSCKKVLILKLLKILLKKFDHSWRILTMRGCTVESLCDECGGCDWCGTCQCGVTEL